MPAGSQIDGDDELMNCFCDMVVQRKAFSFISKRNQLSEILTISNLQHATSKTPLITTTYLRNCENIDRNVLLFLCCDSSMQERLRPWCM